MLLISKVISASDMSSSVLLRGRVILPRVQMQGVWDQLAARGRAQHTGEGASGGKEHYIIEVDDQQGRTWTLSLKRWVSLVNGVEKPIFVLEGTLGCFKANHASPGSLMELRESNGHLQLAVLHPDSPQARSCQAYGSPVELLGRCSRPGSCTKGAGHPGFCNGQQSFRSSPGSGRGSSQIKVKPSSKVGGCGTVHNIFEGLLAPRGTAVKEEWVEVECGEKRGALHVPSMQIMMADSRGYKASGTMVPLKQFQASSAPYNSPLPPTIYASPGRNNASKVPLGTWMAEQAFASSRGSKSPQSSLHGVKAHMAYDTGLDALFDDCGARSQRSHALKEEQVQEEDVAVTAATLLSLGRISSPSTSHDDGSALRVRPPLPLASQPATKTYQAQVPPRMLGRPVPRHATSQSGVLLWAQLLETPAPVLADPATAARLGALKEVGGAGMRGQHVAGHHATMARLRACLELMQKQRQRA